MIGNPIIISGGTKLPELTTPGTAADLLSPKQLIDADGNVLTGTMPEVERATPAISVSSAGLITASVSQQTAGYMAGGTTSATKQLTTKAAATITPGTADQTIAAGTYLTGAQTIKGDPYLVPANIKYGTGIFGVGGTCGLTTTYTAGIVTGIQATSKYSVTLTFSTAIDVSKIRYLHVYGFITYYASLEIVYTPYQALSICLLNNNPGTISASWTQTMNSNLIPSTDGPTTSLTFTRTDGTGMVAAYAGAYNSDTDYEIIVTDYS